VTDLQFLVSFSQQATLELPPAPVVDSELLDRVKALGFTERQAIDLLSQHEDAYLRSTLELVEGRMADLSKPALASPAAFMRTALKDNYLSAKQRIKSEPPASKPKKTPSRAQAVADPAEDKERSARLDAAIASFNAMAADEQNELLVQFHAAFPMAKRYRRDGKPFRSTFGEWFSRRDIPDAQTSLV